MITEIKDSSLATGLIKVGDVWGDQAELVAILDHLTVVALFDDKVWLRYRHCGVVKDSVLHIASAPLGRLLRRDGKEYTGKDAVSIGCIVSPEPKFEVLNGGHIADSHCDNPTPDTFECPDCKMVSYNRNDIEHSFCGACNKFFK